MTQWNQTNRITAPIVADIPEEYITQDELSYNSYATTSYVVDYVDTHGGGGSGSEVTYAYLESKDYAPHTAHERFGTHTVCEYADRHYLCVVYRQRYQR